MESAVVAVVSIATLLLVLQLLREPGSCRLAAGLVAAMSDDPDAEAMSGSPEAQSLEAALRHGEGRVAVHVEGAAEPRRFSTALHCA